MNTAEHQLIELGLAGLGGNLPNSQKILPTHPTRKDRALTQSAAQAATPSFAAVWDNDADAVYDKL